MRVAGCRGGRVGAVSGAGCSSGLPDSLRSFRQDAAKGKNVSHLQLQHAVFGRHCAGTVTTRACTHALVQRGRAPTWGELTPENVRDDRDVNVWGSACTQNQGVRRVHASRTSQSQVNQWHARLTLVRHLACIGLFEGQCGESRVMQMRRHPAMFWVQTHMPSALC